MFRLIKIIFNAFVIVLAIMGFNAIGGQKYVETIKMSVGNFIHERAFESAKKIGNFSNINEEFQIENAMNLFGYKAVIAEHKASSQKMLIIDSGKKALLTDEDINSNKLEKKMADLTEKMKYQAITIQDIRVVNHGSIIIYGKKVPYAKFEAKVTRLPFSEIAGIVASVQTKDGNEKLAISVSEKNKYSQLISNEFFKDVEYGE